MTTIVNKVWNGQMFVNTDSDTVDGLHASDIAGIKTRVIDSAVDLNSLTEEGFYVCEDATIAQNILSYPPNRPRRPFSMLVQRSDYCTQIIIDSSRIDFGVTVRAQAGASQWSEWKTVAFDDHDHDGEYAFFSHVHNNYADVNHNHDTNYAPKVHEHTHIGATAPTDILVNTWIHTEE